MTNLEVGLQRVFSIVWALWTGGYVAVGLYQVLNGYRFHTDEVLAWIGVAVVAPPVIMFSVRWIYRGFRSGGHSSSDP